MLLSAQAEPDNRVTMNKRVLFEISALWDMEAQVWSGHCDDIPAAANAPMLDALLTSVYGDFIALPATSRPQTDNAVALTGEDLLGGSLPAPSWVRTNRVVTLNSSLVVKSIGRVSERVVSAAIVQLVAYFGYPER